MFTRSRHILIVPSTGGTGEDEWGWEIEGPYTRTSSVGIHDVAFSYFTFTGRPQLSMLSFPASNICQILKKEARERK
jgi:hypothetical protein